MSTKPTPVEELQKVIDAFHLYGEKRKAANALGINYSTFMARFNRANLQKIKPKPNNLIVEHDKTLKSELAEAKAKIRALETAAKMQVSEDLTADYIKKQIVKLSKSTVDVPTWVSKPPKKDTTGVPTLFASDWHWGEVVRPAEIGGVNEYNSKIAQERARSMIETTIDLLRNHLNNPEYPGIVFILGGDMVSGSIHEELMVSNDLEMMPTILDLWGVLVWCIERLAGEFGKVFIPCVTGNHGRNTHKIYNKGRNHTSFDWLLYQFLAKRFEADGRITFYIPDGSDAYYSIYGHRYLLTHGDQFRGGDGVIGALGPIIRGDHKKRSRNAQIDQEYDTMLLGHWHQLIQLQRLIVNGSLKGYDEYAYANNFGFEPPRQGLWITHPHHGITFSCAVNVERKKELKKTEWVSWAK